MKIFVKSSNRACALDRCLWSIGERLSGHDGIVILDDGMDERFLERIADKYKETEIRRSPHGAEKRSMALGGGEDLHRQFVERGWDPAPFWYSEISYDTGTYVALAEEDCWFRRDLDLEAVEGNLINRNTVILRLKAHAGEFNTAAEIHQFTDELPGPLTLQYYMPALQGLDDIVSVFTFAMAVYRRDYWCRAIGGQSDFLQEFQAIKGALEFIEEAQEVGELLRFAKTRERVAGSSLISTSRLDSGGAGVSAKIDHAVYNRVVDEAWLRGEFDPLSGYPGDWPFELLKNFYRDRLGNQRTAEWLTWRKAFGEMNAWTNASHGTGNSP